MEGIGRQSRSLFHKGFSKFFVILRKVLNLKQALATVVRDSHQTGHWLVIYP